MMLTHWLFLVRLTAPGRLSPCRCLWGGRDAWGFLCCGVAIWGAGFADAALGKEKRLWVLIGCVERGSERPESGLE